MLKFPFDIKYTLKTAKKFKKQAKLKVEIYEQFRKLNKRGDKNALVGTRC